MPTKIDVSPKYSRSYKSEATLTKAIEKLNIPRGIRYLVYPLEEKFTAVFFVSANNPEQSPYLSYLAHRGFKVIA